jgi:hypothetical protein
MKNKKIKTIAELFFLIVLMTIMPFVSAEVCSGQNCNMNVSLNVTASPTPLSKFTITGQAIYDVLDSSGAGLGTFFVFMGQSLPILFFGIIIVAIIIAVAYAVFKSIKLWREK